jgi:hypothetical protein
MRIGIVICRTKVTNSDVLDEIDWYFLCYETDASRWYFKLYRRVAGGDVTTVFSKDAEVPLDWDISRSLKLSISDGVIRVYEHGVERYSEEIWIAPRALHVYLIGWHGFYSPNWGYFDNFSLSGLLLNEEALGIVIYANWEQPSSFP